MSDEEMVGGDAPKSHCFITIWRLVGDVWKAAQYNFQTRQKRTSDGAEAGRHFKQPGWQVKIREFPFVEPMRYGRRVGIALRRLGIFELLMQVAFPVAVQLGLAFVFTEMLHDVCAVRQKVQQHNPFHPEWQGERYGKEYGGGFVHLRVCRRANYCCLVESADGFKSFTRTSFCTNFMWQTGHSPGCSYILPFSQSIGQA